MDLTWLQDLLRTSGEVYTQVRTVDALNHQQRAADGTMYTNGAFGTQMAANNSGMLLLLGGAVLLILLVKD